jgi:hypothetical protein
MCGSDYGAHGLSRRSSVKAEVTRPTSEYFCLHPCLSVFIRG